MYHYATQQIPLENWYNPAKIHVAGFGAKSIAGAELLNARLLVHADSSGSLLDNVKGKTKGSGNSRLQRAKTANSSSALNAADQHAQLQDCVGATASSNALVGQRVAMG